MMSQVSCPLCGVALSCLANEKALALATHFTQSHAREILPAQPPAPPPPAPFTLKEEPFPLEGEESPLEEEEWQERTPEFITFDEPGQEILGTLEGLDEITFHDKPISRARISTADGVQSFLLTTQLEPLLAGLIRGTQIKIRYEGEELTSGKRRIKKFRLWTKRGG